MLNHTPLGKSGTVGRDAPTLGEDFRVRLSYADLRKKAPWRV